MFPRVNTVCLIKILYQVASLSYLERVTGEIIFFSWYCLRMDLIEFQMLNSLTESMLPIHIPVRLS